MIVKIIKCLKDNYSYLIIDEKLNTACVVDPSESRPIINYLEDRNNWNTSSGFHVQGGVQFKLLIFDAIICIFSLPGSCFETHAFL